MYIFKFFFHLFRLFFDIFNSFSLLTKLEKGVETEIASIENEYSINIDKISIWDILQPSNYVEHWRLILWGQGFPGAF